MILYRPVGPKEYELIKDSGFRIFPPRLDEQPIFYPVLNQKYAEEIARRWNVKDSGCGYVLEFDMDDEYLSQYDIQTVGASYHQEYWIPSDRLWEFNKHIIGQIKVRKKFSGKAEPKEKIAVISDIHGNYYALKAVLQRLRTEQVDQIICLGDMITDYPQFTYETLNMVRESCEYMICGNRERYLLDHHRNQEASQWKDAEQFSTLKKTYSLLSKQDIEFLEQLPNTQSIQMPSGVRMLAVHGSPQSDSELLLPEKTDQISHYLSHLQEDILLCGHTHRPFTKTENGKTILNPGSLGNNFVGVPVAQYALIHSDGTDYRVDLRTETYDFRAFRQTCDMEDIWIHLCVRSTEDGVNYNMRFLEEAQSRTHGLWPIPNDTYRKLFADWRESGIL